VLGQTLIVFAHAIYNLCFHPLAHIPGPFWARTTGWVMAYRAIKGRKHEWLMEMLEKYGKTRVRIAPNYVVFCDPDAYGDIYGTHANTHRSVFYQGLRTESHSVSVLCEPDRASHAQARKLLNPCFNDKSLQAASTFVISHVDRWHELQLQLMPQGKENSHGWSSPIDMTTSLGGLIFDIMGDLAFGKSFDIKEPGDNPLKSLPAIMGNATTFRATVCEILSPDRASKDKPAS
jgi:cytochrome P450